MPTYEYLCEKCEHEFERDQRITDPPVKTCPKCKARRVKKLISQTSFVLKGGGWYSDLYSSTKGDKSSAESSDGKSSSDATSKSDSDSSSDSKSDSSSDSKSDDKSKGKSKSDSKSKSSKSKKKSAA